MTIYKNFKSIILAASVPMLFMACDNIDESERYIELEQVSAKRVVILEEFTGQDCTNCPDGHRIAAQLKEQYGDAFIPVSIHAGQLSWSETEFGEYGLGIPEGEIYYKANQSPALPAGVIDRNSGILNRSDWASRIRTELEKESHAEIDIKPTYDKDTQEILIDIDFKGSFSGNLTVWILESGIINYQYDNGQHVQNYTHNHVLRAVVSDVWGDPLQLTDGSGSKQYTYDIAANGKTYWDIDNISIVAFISDGSGIQQAAEAHLIQPDSSENDSSDKD